ncbi:MAG: M23 family metallopeptidase [Ignavibacteriae bacterium]|nr:M23 family metallopeptidase [Ignavibacteriota bacterium]
MDLINHNRHKKIFWYSDNQLKLHEIKWFWLKLGGIILGLLVFCLVLVFGVNQFYYNFLHLGNSRLNELAQENRMLRENLRNLTSELVDLKSHLDKVAKQGDQLRLLVDLPQLDNETKVAGTGGAVNELLFSGISGQTNQLLQSISSTLQSLNSEVRVQAQSYSEIIRKYDSNKGLFAAMPALKPMDGFYSAKDFGKRMHPVLGIFKAHEGLDIINDVGTPVAAAANGIVQVAGQSGGGYGIVVVINHGYGYQTLYAHLSKVLVREGQRVKRGDLIAKSGKSGLVNGPHLHYEVRHHGVCRNPADFFFDDVSLQEYQRQLLAH